MADLPGIPPVPNGAPKELAGWFGAVRSRLLKLTGNQFTDAEASKLRALLGTKPAVTTQAGVQVTFLASPYTFYSGQGEAAWKTIDIGDAGVPATATAVVIDIRWTLLSDVGPEARWAALRIDGTYGEGSATINDAFLLAYGLNGQSAHGVAQQTGGSQQGIFPVANSQFEYSSGRTGYGWSEIVLRIVGYVE